MCLAVPARVISVSDRDGTRVGEVDFGGAVRDVCLDYVPDTAPGEYVVVHLGYAIERLDEQSARETIADLERLGRPEQ